MWSKPTRITHSATTPPQKHKPASVGSTLTLSPSLMASTTRGLLYGYELMVCDMAGTTVDEGGLVYQLLRECIADDGMTVTEAEMHPWHGAKKETVIEHFARLHGTQSRELEDRVQRVGQAFLERIETACVRPASPLFP